MIDQLSQFVCVNLGTLIPYSLTEPFEYLSTELTPSESEPCHCCSCFRRKKKERKKFTVRRMPGKIAHLVPMQRFDPAIHRPALSMVKPSNIDEHLPTKFSPPLTNTTNNFTLTTKFSADDSQACPNVSSSHLNASTSINSLKPSTDQTRNVNPDDLLSQTRLQTMLSRFRQDLQLTPYRLDLKRSSV